MFFFLCMLWENFYLWISYGPPQNTYTGVPRPDSFARMRGVLISWREHFPRSFENLFRAVFTWQSKVTRVYIGFASVRCAIGLKNSRHFFIQSEWVKLGLIVTRSRVFSRALPQLCLFTLSFDWFSVFSMFCFWLVRVIILVLVLRHSVENCSMKHKILTLQFCSR